MSHVPSRRATALVAALLLALAVLPGSAAAATRSGGTVVVAAGETVDGLTAYGGTVIVRGTVEGDLTAYAGTVHVAGEVTGDVQAYAGTVRITGTVGGTVEVAGGNVVVGADATVGRLDASAGNVLLAGTVEGDARLAGGSVTLAETADVAGTVEYAAGEGGFTNEGASVGGRIVQREDLDAGASSPAVPGWTVDVYGVLVTLMLGAVLLLVAPEVSRTVAERAARDPLRTGAVGLAALVGIPVGLVLLAVTVVGIPLSLVGGLLFVILVWVAAVYGRFALGSWLASLAGVRGRWVGLLVGVLVVAVLKAAAAVSPLTGWIGGLLEFALLLLGLGALAGLGYAALGDRRPAA